MVPLDEFLLRALQDSQLTERLLADPSGVLLIERVAVRPADVRTVLGIPGATDWELYEMVLNSNRQARCAGGRLAVTWPIELIFPDGPPEVTRRGWRVPQTGLPLGVRPETGLANDLRAALDALETYDLSPVIQYLNHTSVLPSEWRSDGVFELRRYLGLRRAFGRSFAMFSEQVDEIWHTCLLFTDLYANWCGPVFGELAHHDPWDEPKPEQIVSLWQDFYGAYAELYGDPSYLWTLRLPQVTALPTQQARAAETNE